MSYILRFPDGWELRDGAFGPPPPGAKNPLYSAYDKQKTVVILLHRGVRWDLLVPVQGQERAFQ
jgi:hypothetical protein